MKRSIKCTVRAPNVSPKMLTKTPPISKAGIIRLKDVAASITPAEKPNITSSSLSETFFVIRIGKAPKPVARPARRLASKPNVTISIKVHVFP